ncbi:MAG: Nucleoside diphosphate pyrophosphatase [Tardiphaga sp.]|nr:Nucleoside diphosphate pyrophosphatase [Tardiphaga sp.]
MSARKQGDAIADRAAEVTLSQPVSIGRGYMRYERFEISLPRDGEDALLQKRDVIRAGRVAAVLPIDLVRGEIVLLRQFRLPAHLATGRGDMVEIVAGRVDGDESAKAAASRECFEEIGVTPDRLHELYSVLPTPGFTDEYVTFFLGFIDAAKVLTRGGLIGETEDTHPFVVPIDTAIAVLGEGAVFNGLMISALQWLALNRDRLHALYDRATPAG